jgi:hypothetical protein
MTKGVFTHFIKIHGLFAKVYNFRMMKDMCAVADLLGAYLPGSSPQFMDPGLALHITVC